MKHMKKSMFITTVMMVVLLIVAVSTATFAWYTSSNTVNTTEAEVSSAQSTDANISIGWSDNTVVGHSSIDFKTDNVEYVPMSPLYVGTEGFVFNASTAFRTASMSFGKLYNPSSATPYLGTDPDSASTTFYIINYSRTATNITFTSTTAGENADRLRIAIFQVGGPNNGLLVYTNKDLYYATENAEVPEHYELLASAPGNWSTQFATYYTKSGEVYTPVAGVAPTFQPNIYYAKNAEGSALTVAPEDWGTKWFEYSTTGNGIKTAVAGVAPTFAADTYYEKIALKPKELIANQVFTQISVQTNIGASNGVNGIAQGFVVKVWFDGPTQMDQHGGQKATFTLTATAAVAP
ncbi:hypothetical protein EOM82_00550 [bacterium]|nr:hypothetical protein [bacterium]